MANLDLAKTQIVQELLAQPAAARDDAWLERFYANVVEASFAGQEPQIVRGPDGFPYFALVSPKPGEPFTAFSVAHVLNHCTENGYGLVIDPGADPAQKPPGWVFPYGFLWSLRAHGQFTGDPADEVATGATGPQVVEKERQILVAAPSETFLPPWARRVLHAFLSQAVGLQDPRVCLVIDATLRPSRNLVFNLFPDDPALTKPFQAAMNRLIWFLPPRRGLLALDRKALAPESFQPL